MTLLHYPQHDSTYYSIRLNLTLLQHFIILFSQHLSNTSYCLIFGVFQIVTTSTSHSVLAQGLKILQHLL